MENIHKFKNIDAEQQVLGSLLVDPTYLHSVLEIIDSEMFSSSEHMYILLAIEHLDKEGGVPDIVSVSELLKKNNLLDDAGGRPYISELAMSVTSPERCVQNAKIVFENYKTRETILLLSSAVYNLEEGAELELVLQKIQDTLSSNGTKSKSTTEAIGELLTPAYNDIETSFQNKGNPSGKSTGYYDLDMMTTGLHPGDLIILAGRPAMGKTALATNIAVHIAENEQLPVVFFSLEMSGKQLATRVLCFSSGVNSQKVRTGRLNDSDFKKLANGMTKISEFPLYIDDRTDSTVSSIRAAARRIQSITGEQLGLLVIDYLQLMQSGRDNGNRVAEVSAISRGLKLAAKDLNCPVLALSQLSRAVESRDDKRPRLSDLRESGSIEQDADLVAFIYRDEYYYENTNDPGVAELIISKQRSGPTGTVKLLFNNQLTSFHNLHNNKKAWEDFNRA